MDETSGATRTASAKEEFFSADMYMFRVEGLPAAARCADTQSGSAAGRAAGLWRTNPASGRHIPGPGAEGVAFSTQSFSLINSGNRTLHAPKRSWKITLEHAAGAPTTSPE